MKFEARTVGGIAAIQYLRHINDPEHNEPPPRSWVEGFLWDRRGWVEGIDEGGDFDLSAWNEFGGSQNYDDFGQIAVGQHKFHVARNLHEEKEGFLSREFGSGLYLPGRLASELSALRIAQDDSAEEEDIQVLGEALSRFWALLSVSSTRFKLTRVRRHAGMYRQPGVKTTHTHRPGRGYRFPSVVLAGDRWNHWADLELMLRLSAMTAWALGVGGRRWDYGLHGDPVLPGKGVPEKFVGMSYMNELEMMALAVGVDDYTKRIPPVRLGLNEGEEVDVMRRAFCGDIGAKQEVASEYLANVSLYKGYHVELYAGQDGTEMLVRKACNGNKPATIYRGQNKDTAIVLRPSSFWGTGDNQGLKVTATDKVVTGRCSNRNSELVNAVDTERPFLGAPQISIEWKVGKPGLLNDGVGVEPVVDSDGPEVEPRSTGTRADRLWALLRSEGESSSDEETRR
jgi:hypothetical protein